MNSRIHAGVFALLSLAATSLTDARAETRYAYVPYAEGEDRDVRVVTEKGGLVAKVKDVNDPALSPDGKQLAVTVFSKEGRKLALVELASGDRQELSVEGKEVYGSLWSPQGDWIAFHILTDKRWQVGVVRADGSGFKILGADISKEEDLYLAGWNLKTGEPLAHDMKSLVQLKLDGSVAWKKPLKELFGQEYASSNCQFWIAPNGSTAYGNFEVQEDEIKDIHGPSNYLVSADLEKGNPQRLTPKGLHVGQPVMAFDGESMIFAGFTGDDIKKGKGDDVDMTMRIYRIKLADKSIAPIFEKGWFPTLSR